MNTFALQPPIKTKVVNSQKVKPIKFIVEPDSRPVLGYEIIPGIYANIVVFGRKGSGKSMVVFFILKNGTGIGTRTLLFGDTLNNDPGWLAMRKWLDNKNRFNTYFLSLTDSETGANHLKGFLDKLKKEADEKILEEKQEKQEELEEKKAELERKKGLPPPPPPYNNGIRLRGFVNSPPITPELSSISPEGQLPIASAAGLQGRPEALAPTKKVLTLEEKAARAKYQAPKWQVVFDDISAETKHSVPLESIYKENRHFGIRTITSTQNITDLPPAARRQANIWIIFAGMPPSSLEIVYKDAGIRIPYDEFVTKYHHATSEKHNFLYINADTGELGRNFNEKYQ